MRAAATLRLLSEWSADVHLLVIPIYDNDTGEPDQEIALLCRSWQVVTNPSSPAKQAPLPEWLDALAGLTTVPREWQYYNKAWQSAVTATMQRLKPGLVVVFRFYLAPFFITSVGPGTPVWLDADEVESTSRARLANLLAIAGHQREAYCLRMEALAYEKLETYYLKCFERIFACSRIEIEGILQRAPGANIHLLPNTYPAVSPQRPREGDGKARFLYLGTFGYYPNADAVIHFCKDVLPLIRARTPVPVELDVIGSGLAGIAGSLSTPGVHLIGPVPQTTPYYADCDAAIVPLRAASGTRIKILEAFSHERAVISTTVGAEGLEVKAGDQLYIADGAEEFANHCLRLINDVDERDRLARRGHEFFREHHTPQKLQERVPQMFGDWSRAK